MRVSIATLLAAAYTGLATACSQQPVGSNPSGNPISRPVLEVVEAGKPFTITWNPTTQGTVSIVLLRGPAINVIPIDCLGDNIPNTGTFSWTPATTLEPDVTGYGLQIIVTGTGQFQYSTQFGISNPKPTVPKSSAATSAAASAKPTGKPITQISDGQIQVPTSVATSTPRAISHTPIITLKYNSTSSLPGSVYSASSRASLKFTTRLNTTVVLPTKSVPLSVPSGAAYGTGSGRLPQNPTLSPTLALSTGGAGRLFAQGGAVGLLGIFVAALL